MKCFVTGGTGFLGAALVRKLLEHGDEVVCLARRGNNGRNLEGLPVYVVYGDLLDEGSLVRAMQGCQRVYHAAAEYSLWVPDSSRIYDVNVQGTKNVLEAALKTGVERVVYTSTVGALGNPGDGTPGTEDTPVGIADMSGDYKKSKFLAEREAENYINKGLPVVIVNPSTPVGPRDVKPTPTGKMILDFIKGKMFAYIDTGLNLIDVGDAAEGHILAMEKGVPGQKYILGNRDMTLEEIFKILSGLTGIRAPKVKLPYWSVLPIAYVSTKLADYVTKKPPLAPLDAVKMSKKLMFFDPSKAVRELGLPQSPVEDALMRAVEWFRENGYA